MRRRTLLSGLLSLPLLVACSRAEAPTAVPSSSSNSPTSAPGYRLERIVDGLDMARAPVLLASGRHLVPDQTGVVHLLEEGVLRPEPVLDLTDALIEPTRTAQEIGVAGIAPAPDFQTSGDLFVVYTGAPRRGDPAGTTRADVISRWHADTGTLVVDPASEQVLLRIPHGYQDHVGGGPIFDDEGRLYVAVGAESGDTRAQDPRNLDGTILRIEPTKGAAYTIPEDNPFVANGGRPEIFSYGYRNPFRMHWDDEVGIVVALPMWTEMSQQIGVATLGGNSGYPLVSLTETDTCWTGEGALAPDCREIDGKKIVAPVAEYPRQVGDIVSGAIVYRGSTLPELTGKAVVADWKGAILAAEPTGRPWQLTELDVSDPESEGGTLWDMSTDGEDIYVCYTNFGRGKGRVYRLVANG